MTITTANWPVALKLTPLALAAMLLSNECRADWRITPSVNLHETYTDNVNNQSDAQARGSWVSSVQPGLSITENGPNLTFNANAQWERYFYQADDVANLHNSQRTYSATGQAKVVPELFYVDASATESRQAVSAFGAVSDNGFSALNNTSVRTWRISPYLVHRFGTFATASARLTRDRVESNQTIGFGNSSSTTRIAQLNSGTAFVDLGWNASYNRQDLTTAGLGGSTSENSLVGLSWRAWRHLTLIANVGYDSYNYSTISQATSGRSWSTGFSWVPSTHTSVEATFGRHYYGKTGSLNAKYRTPRTNWSLLYNDAVTTSRSQFLLPATYDTAALLDNMFAAAYPDPVQRQLAVQAYIAAAGLPAALSDSINYLSNRYVRQKRLQADGIVRGAHSDLLISLYKDEREGLSLQQADSTLLPSQLNTLNDHTKQRGANAAVSYHLSSRQDAHASANIIRALSVDTGIVNNIRQFNLGTSRRFGAKTTGSLDLSHSESRTDALGNAKSRSNTVLATLSVLF